MKAAIVRAVERWDLEDGFLSVTLCGCRAWITSAGSRPVYTCRQHRR